MALPRVGQRAQRIGWRTAIWEVMVIVDGTESRRLTVPTQQTDAAQRAAASARFQDLYREHFDFVFRNLCRLGVPRAQADDALQDVFIVVLRRLSDFDPETSARAWLFAILVRVASDYRRRQRRKGHAGPLPEGDTLPGEGPGPYEAALHSEAVDRLHRCLDALDAEKRSVFVMTELEQMTAPEIASTLGINVNTIYTRLRAARKAFAEAASQLEADTAEGTDHG